jgi:carbonic anhydrase
VVAAVGIAVTPRAAAPTGSAGLARLKAGNARFVASPAEALPIDAAKRAALATGQTPFASILTCADSHVPPEVVFHAGLGDLFVVRAAGHVADRSVLASLEYAAEHLQVPLLVVMGHESCSAVRSTLDTPATQSLGPNLDYLLKAIRPATLRAGQHAGEARLRAAILEHVEETINELMRGSPALRRRSGSGMVTLVGAYYELSTGRVHFSDVVSPTPAGAPAAGHAAAVGHP